jgi:hypothetical protein
MMIIILLINIILIIVLVALIAVMVHTSLLMSQSSTPHGSLPQGITATWSNGIAEVRTFLAAAHPSRAYVISVAEKQYDQSKLGCKVVPLAHCFRIVEGSVGIGPWLDGRRGTSARAALRRMQERTRPPVAIS